MNMSNLIAVLTSLKTKKVTICFLIRFNKPNHRIRVPEAFGKQVYYYNILEFIA